MLDELRGGLSYVRHHGSLVGLIVLAATTTFLGFSVLTFLPLFTQRVFHQGAATYSYLLAFSRLRLGARRTHRGVAGKVSAHGN